MFKILFLINIISFTFTFAFVQGLKFGRSKKNRLHKVDLSDEEQRKFIETGEQFGKELANKLENETGNYNIII
jgi:hypothetical protein